MFWWQNGGRILGVIICLFSIGSGYSGDFRIIILNNIIIHINVWISKK